MRTVRQTSGRRFLAPALLLMVILTACGSGNANATPTLGIDAIFTAAFQTIQAQEATQLALTPPTDIPSPSPFPTLPPPSPIPTISFASSTPLTGNPSACDNAVYVSDVSIPDGTTVKAGSSFTKTWRIYNGGTCSWTTSYRLAFDNGDSMGGSATLLPATVPAGSQTDISVVMTAPTTNGTFKGNWRMQNAGGLPFGNVIYVEIKVSDGSGTAVPTSASGMVTISGTFNVTDVTLEFSGISGSAPTVNYGTKSYNFIVAKGWSGTVTPKKGVYVFSPAAYSFTNVQADQTVSFVADDPTPTATVTPG
jgi:hypothetical protein